MGSKQRETCFSCPFPFKKRCRISKISVQPGSSRWVAMISEEDDKGICGNKRSKTCLEKWCHDVEHGPSHAPSLILRPMAIDWPLAIFIHGRKPADNNLLKFRNVHWRWQWVGTPLYVVKEDGITLDGWRLARQALGAVSDVTLVHYIYISSADALPISIMQSHSSPYTPISTKHYQTRKEKDWDLSISIYVYIWAGWISTGEDKVTASINKEHSNSSYLNYLAEWIRQVFSTK